MPLFRRRSDAPVTPSDEPVEPVRTPRRLALPRLSFAGDARAWLMLIVLIAITIFAILLNQGRLPPEVVTWWPLAVAIPALLWFLISLARRETRGLLASTALLGLSVSMLLAAQNIASLSATWVGITFIAVGTGIVLRGLLLRHQPIG